MMNILMCKIKFVFKAKFFRMKAFTFGWKLNRQGKGESKIK